MRGVRIGGSDTGVVFGMKPAQVSLTSSVCVFLWCAVRIGELDTSVLCILEVQYVSESLTTDH